MKTVNTHWMRDTKHLCSIIAVLIILSANASAEYAIPIKYVGKWVAYSRGTIAVHGDMEIRKDKIHWERHGWVRYRVISIDGNGVFLELAKDLNCGRFILLSPYDDPLGFHKGSLAMSEFRTGIHSDPNASCGWGLYDPPDK